MTASKCARCDGAGYIECFGGDALCGACLGQAPRREAALGTDDHAVAGMLNHLVGIIEGEVPLDPKDLREARKRATWLRERAESATTPAPSFPEWTTKAFLAHVQGTGTHEQRKAARILSTMLGSVSAPTCVLCDGSGMRVAEDDPRRSVYRCSCQPAPVSTVDRNRYVDSSDTAFDLAEEVCNHTDNVSLHPCSDCIEECTRALVAFAAQARRDGYADAITRMRALANALDDAASVSYSESTVGIYASAARRAREANALADWLEAQVKESER